MILKVLILILILIVVPFICGLLPTFFNSVNRTTISVIYLSGMILSLAIFQLMSVPIVIADPFGFGLIVVLYSCLIAVACIAAVVLTVIKVKKNGRLFAQAAFNRNLTVEEIVEWIIFAILILFQIVMFMKMASFDGDDAYYVVESLLSTQTDTLYRIRPYTGLSTSFDLRHSLAVFPIWIAYISSKRHSFNGSRPSHTGDNTDPAFLHDLYRDRKECLKKRKKQAADIYDICGDNAYIRKCFDIYKCDIFDNKNVAGQIDAC